MADTNESPLHPTCARKEVKIRRGIENSKIEIKEEEKTIRRCRENLKRTLRKEIKEEEKTDRRRRENLKRTSYEEINEEEKTKRRCIENLKITLNKEIKEEEKTERRRRENLKRTSYETGDSGCPDSSVSLEAHHIRKKYKDLKKEMNTEIVDYLVQSNILTTDENSFLLHKSRAEKCDFILRRLIRDSNCLTKFRTLMLEEPKVLDVFDCFRSLMCNTSPEPEIPNSDKQVSENDSEVFVHNLKLDVNRRGLLDLFRRHINSKSSNSILDDFLQEDLITAEEHEEISLQSEIFRTKAAELLLAAVERSCPLKLLSILKSYDGVGLADRLQQQLEEQKIDVDKEFEASFSVWIRDGKIYMFSCADKPKVEMKINYVDENRIDMTCLMKSVSKTEETLAQKTHCSVEGISEGSIIVLLQPETRDAVEKLRKFIESGDISNFLKQLFESMDVPKLLKKDNYTIEIEIKKVQSSETDFPANVLQGTDTPKFKYKSILERCHCFLLEELEPGYFLRNEEVAAIFASVTSDVKEQPNRTAKNKLLLEHLKKQSEEKIQLVLEKLEKTNGYIYRQLFPKIEKFQDIDIEQVKRNILDNLPELLDEINIETLQTPFLSTGVITCEELDALRSSSESLRTENLQFVKLVLHRGAEAIRIFLGSLENYSRASELSRRLTKTEIEDTCEGKSRNTKIKYEAFEEENGLLFTGNFLIELRKDTNESPEQKCLYVKHGEINWDSGISIHREREDLTSSESIRDGSQSKQNERSTKMEVDDCKTIVLQENLVVIFKILQLLPMKTLHSCARVCKAWNEIVTEIKRKRSRLHWFCLEGEGRKEDLQLQNISDQMMQAFQKFTSEPSYLFVFCTSALYEKRLEASTLNYRHLPWPCRQLLCNINSIISSLGPKSCKCYSLAAGGIIGSNGDRSVEIEHSPLAVACLAIPKLEGLEIYDFFIDLKPNLLRTLFDVKDVTSVPYDKEVKAILFFSDGDVCPQEIPLYLLNYYNGCPVVGGYGDHILSPDLDTAPGLVKQIHCIALCGSKVQVASVIIKNKVSSERNIERELCKLKDCNLPMDTTFAFMFACLGRERAFHNNKDNVESDIFRKLFPKTPLFGFFGNRTAIGMNYLHPFDPSKSFSKSKKTKFNRHHPKLFHAYTSIFLLVSVSSE
ncbi:uncharacterized protein LOC144619747 isoform X2 [Crassostrea virginica]